MPKINKNKYNILKRITSNVQTCWLKDEDFERSGWREAAKLGDAFKDDVGVAGSASPGCVSSIPICVVDLGMLRSKASQFNIYIYTWKKTPGTGSFYSTKNKEKYQISVTITAPGVYVHIYQSVCLGEHLFLDVNHLYNWPLHSFVGLVCTALMPEDDEGIVVHIQSVLLLATIFMYLHLTWKKILATGNQKTTLVVLDDTFLWSRVGLCTMQFYGSFCYFTAAFVGPAVGNQLPVNRLFPRYELYI